MLNFFLLLNIFQEEKIEPIDKFSNLLYENI